MKIVALTLALCALTQIARAQNESVVAQPTPAEVLAAMPPAERFVVEKRARRSVRFRRASMGLFITGFIVGIAGLASAIAALRQNGPASFHNPLFVTPLALGFTDSVTEAVGEPLRAVANDDARFVRAMGLTSLRF